MLKTLDKLLFRKEKQQCDMPKQLLGIYYILILQVTKSRFDDVTCAINKRMFGLSKG